MKKIASIALLVMTTLAAQAQKVTFYSPEFENGVRHHIGLKESDDVLQTQTDTITTLNLSGLEITDIRDVAYLTKVSKLDLSYNNISDLSPLLSLESLYELNLSNNQLVDINILAFIQSESLKVDVSNNYISDFSYFYTPGLCDITFYGMGLQTEKDAPYFDIYQFYAIIDGSGQPTINYRGYTNMTAATSVKCGSSNETIQIDGDNHTTILPIKPKGITEIALTNGERTIKTYAVPTKFYKVKAENTILLDTGLPEDYSLTSAYASKGSLEIVGNTIKYTAPKETVSDVVYFSYYEGSNLKGFSRFYLNKGDANDDSVVDNADLKLVVDHIMNPKTGINKEVADMNNDGNINAADVVLFIDTTK